MRELMNQPHRDPDVDGANDMNGNVIVFLFLFLFLLILGLSGVL